MKEKNYKAKETMLVISVAFMVLHLLFRKDIWLYLALSAGLIGVSSFYLSSKIDFAWSRLSLLLGEINSTILLTITFFIIVTPVALIRKLSGKKNMLSPLKKSPGYFSDRNHLYEKKDFEKTW